MVLAHTFDGNRTQDVLTSRSIAFDSMLLETSTLRGLKESGFYRPSPVQLCGIPLGKCGFDLLLEAKSGTGKTAVFVVLALEKLNLNNGLQSVILAPTREIAAQICDVIKQIGSNYEGLKVEVVMGGLPFYEDVVKFKDNNVHIVVGSPGRMRHLIQDKHINVSAVRLLVLDEADKLVEKSFMPDINYIFSILPKEKQVIMSSATYTDTAKQFIERYVRNAQHICPDSNSILLGIRQKVTSVKSNSNIVKQTAFRFEELVKILTTTTFKQCLIFCNYQARVADVHKMLTKKKWPAEQLYGKQEQSDRLDALRSLQEYKCRILISTDLAARGIDASNVDLVINFEPPYDWQTYLHRIGRAGRFGSFGVAITILSEGNEQKKFMETLKGINAPINIRNLWTDTDPIEGEQLTGITTNGDLSAALTNVPEKAKEISETGPINNEQTLVNYEELWNMLLSDFNEEHLHVEDFDNLCHSFEEPDIESFSDLINSHENHEYTPNAAITYNHLKIPEMQITNFMQNIHDVTRKNVEKIMPPEMDANKEKMVIKNASDGDQLQDYASEICINGAQETNKYKDIQHKTERCMQNGINREHVERLSDDEYYVPNIDKDLMKAGLPTAFSSSKMKNNKDKRKNMLETFEVEPKIIEEQRKVDCTQACTSKKDHTKTTNESFQSIYTCSSENTPRQFIKNKENKYLNKNKTRNIPMSSAAAPWSTHTSKKRYQGCSTTSSYSTEESTSSTSTSAQYSKYKGSSRTNQHKCHLEPHLMLSDNQNYINWYQNLKLRVKQIEYALYIEEITKLQENIL